MQIIFVVTRTMPNTISGSNDNVCGRFVRAWWACLWSGQPLERDAGFDACGVRGE
jgi:hypothetical protein